MGSSPRRHRPSTCLLAVVVLLGLAVGCSGDGDGDGDAAASTTTAEGGDGAAEEGSLTVLTYNVAGLPQEISSEQPEVNIPLISPLLDAYDVVLTQEDFDWWKPGGLADGLDFNEYHDRLRADVDLEFQSPTHPGPEAAGLDPGDRPEMELGDGIGIMARFPLSDFDQQAWTGCFGGFDTSDGGAADCLAMKGVRVATMDLGGVEVDVYSLHAEAGGTQEDQRLQAEDYDQLAAFMAERSEGRAVILGGDTNLHVDPGHEDSGGTADAEIWAGFLDATGLTDVCDATDCSDPAIIDKVAIRSGGGIELTAEDHEIPVERFSDDAGEPLSDHSPVVATIGWVVTG